MEEVNYERERILDKFIFKLNLIIVMNIFGFLFY